ncbi:MAG: chemotaxis response regulator protein-glutamate methylesterase [Eubacteriales bacterium]
MKIKRKIRVLVVDDSMLFRKTISAGLESDPSFEVVGTASNPYEARDKILELRPDVMTLDVEMPRMTGIEFLKKLIPQYPLPVVMISSADIKVFDAVNSGAVDFIEKPKIKDKRELESFYKELILKVKIASTARINNKKIKKKKHTIKKVTSQNFKSNNHIIAIGASTGGTEAVYSIIKAFTKDMPPILIVQHMPPVFTQMYSERLNKNCSLYVKEAADGDVIEAGKVYIAKGGFQMKVITKGSKKIISIYDGDKVNGHRPSVDPMFNTVADIYGPTSIGVILTGMGTDGAKGLLKMKKKGAFTIGQDEESCIVYGMPKVAYNIGAVSIQKDISEIPSEIIEHLSRLRRRKK